jgi:hypothetical protein
MELADVTETRRDRLDFNGPLPLRGLVRRTATVLTYRPRKTDMTRKEQQLTELLTLTSRSLTHMTAAMTSLSFDLLRSTDPGVRGAASRMIARMESVSRGLDQHLKLISELTGEPQPQRPDAVEEVLLHSVT